MLVMPRWCCMFACLIMCAHPLAGWVDCAVLCLAQLVVVLRDGFRSEWTEIINAVGRPDSSE